MFIRSLLMSTMRRRLLCTGVERLLDRGANVPSLSRLHFNRVRVEGALRVPPPPSEEVGGRGIGLVSWRTLDYRGASSLGRMGRSSILESRANNWHQGNLLSTNSWKEPLKGLTSEISCFGGFGSNSRMYTINGVNEENMAKKKTVHEDDSSKGSTDNGGSTGGSTDSGGSKRWKVKDWMNWLTDHPVYTGLGIAGMAWFVFERGTDLLRMIRRWKEMLDDFLGTGKIRVPDLTPEQIRGKFAAIEEGINILFERLKALFERVKSLFERLKAIEQRLEKVEEQQVTIEDRLSKIEGKE